MTSALSAFINDAGWLAPIYYMLSFVLSALLPFIPTPLIGALGGKAFGFTIASSYGLIGLGLGAFVALNLSRRYGRPIVERFVPAERWARWEALLGIESTLVWGVIFFILNLDFAVLAAGLTLLPLKQLWIAAMIARLPWLLASAWFGDVILISDWVMWVTLVLFVPLLYGLSRVRPWLQGLLIRMAAGRRP